jgi:hypothetical protein
MSVKTNIADYLTQIENLTSTNLQILKTINDSFFTKKAHLFAEIDDKTYVIPSFLSLENKINMLQENFENLVKAPETSEAYFNFDGNTRAIEVRKYSHVPDSIELNNNITSFSIDNNDVFKDFMTPIPYINIPLPSLPNDIVEVNVKKIIAKSNSLKNLFKNKLAYTETVDNKEVVKYHNTINSTFSDIYKLLLNYVEDTDYVEYDTVYKLPIRKNIGTGTYIIEQVVSDEINDDLEEIITLKLRGDLTYKLFDDTIEKPLQVGDELINYDGTGKVKITEVRTNSNTIVVKVVNGEYLNFVGTDSYDTNNDTDIHDLSKLRFHAAFDFGEADKYIKLPLEEDQYVFIAVAALNSRMNVQSSWGTGILMNTFELVNNDIQQQFKTYYDNNVKNLGDVLLEMSNMITSPITSLSQDMFNTLTTLKPVIPATSLSVMQINKHLNSSTTVRNIRNAYNQKKTAEMDLSEVQSKINELNEKLSTISFNDTSGIRPVYTAQLSQFNKQKNELLNTINDSINIISLNVNSAELPIENAKYRIRGFYVPDFTNIDELNINNHIIGLHVQYRYKNISSETGNAVSLTSADNTQTYIYSDWNDLNTRNKVKIAECNNGIYSYNYEQSNEAINEPSYNQIDIPISQGETVDIRLKVIYDFGQPYITMMSDWSEIINISFPDEFAKDVPVLTIIEENNNDIETNRFNNILETTGVNNHINDSFMDQNITYFHKPDTIASGFYTEERRVIPLKDKLQSIVNDIALLKYDIQAANGIHRIGVSIGNSDTEIHSDRDNIIILKPYNSFNNNDENIDGAYIKNYTESELTSVSTMLNISIANTSEHIIKLYSLFPGNRNITLNKSQAIRNKENYSDGDNSGVYFKYLTGVNNSTCSEHCFDENGQMLTHQPNENISLQTQNQFITFRINDPWTLEEYYTDETADSENDKQTMTTLPELTDGKGLVVYPYLNTKYGLCINSDDTRTYMVVNPGEEIIIPLYCEFAFGSSNTDKKEYKKTISFDLRTSLYSDPVNYTFTVVAKNDTSTQDRLTLINKKQLFERFKEPLKYTHTIK